MRRNFSKYVRRGYPWLCFVLFMGAMAFALYGVIRYGDDYYYSTFFRGGLSHFLSETKLHYQTVNGRFFVHLLDCILLSFPLWVWKGFAWCVSGGILLLVSRIACHDSANKKTDPSSLILSCAMFGLLSLSVLRETLLWATGFMNYVFPALLLLVYYRACQRTYLTGSNARYLPVLSFFAAFTTEQGAAAVAICIFFFIRTFTERRKPSRMQILSLITALSAFATVILAPGNRIRMGVYPDFYALSLFDRIRSNIRPLISNAYHSGLFPLFALFLVFRAVYLIRTRDTIHRKTYRVTASVLYFLSAVLLCLAPYLHHTFLIVTAIAVLGAAALFCAAGLLYSFMRGQDTDTLILILCAIMLFCAMLLSPVQGERCMLIPIILIMTAVIRQYRNCAIAYPITAVLPNLLFLLALCNTLRIGYGYLQNLPVHKENEIRISEYIKSERTDDLCLYDSPAPEFGYTLPYMDWYHEMRFKELWYLPPDTVLTYIPYP